MSTQHIAATTSRGPMNMASERIGRIVAVTGAHAIILLDADDAFSASNEGSPEIGTLLKVDTDATVTLALVSALSSPTPSLDNQEQEMRIVEVEFIGELPKDDQGNPKSFRRGVSSYPGLGNIVSRASQTELSMAYASDEDTSIRIGHIQQDITIPAMVNVWCRQQTTSGKRRQKRTDRSHAGASRRRSPRRWARARRVQRRCTGSPHRTVRASYTATA